MRKVLFINLSKQEYNVKTLTELNPYIGGVGVGLKLLLDNIKSDPVIFSVGPLNGFFPYASKTSVVFHSAGAVEDIYIGGALSTRIKFAGIDSIVVSGKSKKPVILDILNEEVSFKTEEVNVDSLGLPGKRAILKMMRNKFFLDDYFLAPENLLEEKMGEKNVIGMAITGTKNFEITDKERFEELYHKILSRFHELSVDKSSNPSCSGCPMGCDKSRIGEIGGNVLIHSLVSCNFAKEIYSNIGVIFSCLHTLGYDYTHEDIEALPVLIDNILKELN